jgi:hypothetical protein
MKARLLLGILLAVPAGASAGPDFVPKPSQAYDGFVALNPPRAEVPVGSLWIDGYGPTGDAAASGNVVTVRSLNGMTIDHNLQVNLSAGLLELIGIDPRFRDHYTARFTDLSIVRVKDVSQLAGAPGEPRIVEALKAASVTVSSEGEIGLNARTTGFEMKNVQGNGTSGRTRTKMIEGRDLFIAIRVATLELVAGNERKVELAPGSSGERVADVDDYRIYIRLDCSPAATTLPTPACSGPGAAVVKLSSHPSAAPAAFEPFTEAGSVDLKLPVPTADGKGGLYDRMVVQFAGRCTLSATERCRDIRVRYAGQRLHDLNRPKANGW